MNPTITGKLNLLKKGCRINVHNVKIASQSLDKHSIDYSYGEYQWGTIAKFRDPDGNLIGFRSAAEHIKDTANN